MKNIKILALGVLFLMGCEGKDAPPELIKLLTPQYKVTKILGKGGESDVFLVKNKEGDIFAAKYWPPEKEHHHLRGTTPFKNSVEVHKALENASYMNHLYETISDKVMILGYLKGPELKEYLRYNLTKEQVIGITEQLLGAFEDMASKKIMALDASAENILVVGTPPQVKFIDTAAYIFVKGVLRRNARNYPHKDFNIYNVDEVKKIYKKMKKENIDGEIIKGRKYALQPPLAFYMVLAESMDLFSALLTKLVYVEKYKNNKFPEYIVKGRWESFGDEQIYLARPWTQAIENRALQLLAKAQFQNNTPSPYTVEDFKKDVDEALAISKLIREKTRACLADINSCLVEHRVPAEE